MPRSEKRRGKAKTSRVAWNKGKTKSDYPQLVRGGRKKGGTSWNKGKRYKTGRKKITPTGKQVIAFNILNDIIRNPNGRKGITMGKILEKAGYSKSIQEAPSLVTGSAGWLKLLEEKFPDGKLTDRMNEQLDAHAIEHYIFSAKMSDEEIREIVEQDFGFKVMRIKQQLNWKRAYFSIPDHLSRDKVIEKILKLKNKYPAEKHEHLIAKVEIVEYR